MNKLYKILIAIILVGVIASCTDESLDPLKFSEVKKGSILALRGTQLNNIYFNSLPGYEIFPKALSGTEQYTFDAEYLSEDLTTLESFDWFVIKRTRNGSSVSTERVLVENVPFSAFKTTEDYRGPWVTVNVPMSQIFSLIGQDPAAPDFAETMLSLYSAGITVEADLNLTDGTKVLASEIVAAGLFQSNQFYPAQRLNIAVTNYCPEDIAAEFEYSTIVTGVGAGGDITGCVGAVTGTGEFASISRGRYSISDATFGQYDCAWGDDPATGVTLINTCDQITIGGADQYDLIYSFENLQVSADGKSMTFNWSNDYGDTGTTTLTRTDGGSWPTTLFTD